MTTIDLFETNAGHLLITHEGRVYSGLEHITDCGFETYCKIILGVVDGEASPDDGLSVGDLFYDDLIARYVDGAVELEAKPNIAGAEFLAGSETVAAVG